MNQICNGYVKHEYQNKTIKFFGLMILISLSILLLIVSIDRYNSYKKEITKLTNITANTAADEIVSKLNSYNIQLSDFAYSNNELIAAVYANKNLYSEENLKLKLALSKQLPNHYLYAIADAAGEEVFHAHGERIGKTCQLDIKLFSENNFISQNIKVHSHKTGYHFDVMTPVITNDGQVIILFVGVQANAISPILEKYTSNDYQLLLTSTERPSLIEITSNGVHDNAGKEIFLNENQLERLLNSIPVEGSLWKIDVIANESLFDNTLAKIIRDAFLLFSLFLLMCSPIFYVLNKQDGKRRAVLDQLKISEAKFFDLYERAPDMYITVDGEGKIQSANKCAREYFGMNREELDNANLMEVISPEDIEGVENHFRSVFEDSLAESEYECHTKDRFGSIKVMHARFSLSEHNEDGKPSVRIVCRDITEQRHLESERIQRIESQRDTLIKEVHHRIKNNLQSVALLLKTYSRKYPELRDVVRDASSKINSIAEVYGLQSATNDQNVYIGDLLISIINNESRIFLTNIMFNVGEELRGDGKIAENEVIPVAVIISELITNSIKYSKKNNFQSNKVVHINLNRNENGVLLEIENDSDENIDSATIDVHLGVGLGQGLSLIRALIPPKGVIIQHKFINQRMMAQVQIDEPVISFMKNQSMYDISNTKI